jgi:hypothetical protein
MPFTPEQIAEAKRCWAYFPYRGCWIALVDGEFRIILKATAATANNLARKGHTVAELKRG